jgi:hypothetical protein
VAREVVFAPEAEDDLLQIYDFIADRASPERAYGYAERIRSYCLEFKIFRPSRRWVECKFSRLIHWRELDRGGHFAAFAQPGFL